MGLLLGLRGVNMISDLRLDDYLLVSYIYTQLKLINKKRYIASIIMRWNFHFIKSKIVEDKRSFLKTNF